jgi:hypothetical protein
VKKPYFLISSKTGPGLDDLLATAGFVPSESPPAHCVFYGYLDDDKLSRGRATLLTGLMDPSTETVLSRGNLVAWRAYEAPSAGPVEGAVREVAIMANGKRWLDVLAALLATGFRPLADDATVLKMEDQGIFLNGFSTLSDDQLRAIDGVDEAAEVVHVDATDPRLHGSTETVLEDGSTKFIEDGDETDPSRSG